MSPSIVTPTSRLAASLLLLVHLVLGVGPRSEWMLCLGDPPLSAHEDGEAHCDHDHEAPAPLPAPAHDDHCSCTDLKLSSGELRLESLRAHGGVPAAPALGLPPSPATVTVLDPRNAGLREPPVSRSRGPTIPRGLSTTRLRL